MKQVVGVLTKILEWICIVLFTLLVIVVVWQVFSRQILDKAPAWSEEASRMIFVWLGLFAAALVFAERGHIAVDFVVRKFAPLGQKVVGIIVQGLIIFFVASVMIYGGIRAGSGAGNQRLAALKFLTLGQMYLVLPISGVLIVIFSVVNIIRILRNDIPPFPLTEEEVLVDELEVTPDTTVLADGTVVDDPSAATVIDTSRGVHPDTPTDRSKEV